MNIPVLEACCFIFSVGSVACVKKATLAIVTGEEKCEILCVPFVYMFINI